MPEVKDKMTGKTVAKMSYDEEGMDAANKMVAENPGYMMADGRNRSEQMYPGGGKTGYSQIGMEKPMMGHGGKMKYMGGGMTPEMMKYEKGGKTKKAVDASKNPGLSKLPKEVRNKMGYMKKGGKAEFKPHMMYKDGKSVKANSYEKHLSLKKQGYGHSMEKMKEGGKANKRSEFQSAFRKARNAGKKTFMYKGESYNTKLKKTPKKTNTYLEAMKKNLSKRKKYDVDSGVKNQKKYDVDSNIKKQKKYDVDSGIKNQKKYSAFLKKGGKVS